MFDQTDGVFKTKSNKSNREKSKWENFGWLPDSGEDLVGLFAGEEKGGFFSLLSTALTLFPENIAKVNVWMSQLPLQLNLLAWSSSWATDSRCKREAKKTERKEV